MAKSRYTAERREKSSIDRISSTNPAMAVTLKNIYLMQNLFV